MHGGWCEGQDQVAKAFTEYYQVLLGTEVPQRNAVSQDIVQRGKVLTDRHRDLRHPLLLRLWWGFLLITRMTHLLTFLAKFRSPFIEN